MTDQNKRKQRIIDAAFKTLETNSIEDVSMRKIAATANLTTGAIYHFYKSKDELLLDVMKQQLHFTTKLYETVHNQNNEFKGRELVDVITSEVANRIRKEKAQKIHVQFFSDVIKKDCKIREEYQKNYRNIIKATASLFEDSFHIKDHGYHTAIASILVAAMDGIAMQQALEVVPDDIEKIIETYTEFFSEYIPQFLNNKGNTNDSN